MAGSTKKKLYKGESERKRKSGGGGNSGRNVRKGMQIMERRKVEIKRDKCE